ncbi:F0F1 ATP synthase subunit gamma [Segnochrobactraceae bacterium EtOH-i3]
MSERLGDVEARIATVRQLSAVIAAMRGIAAARSREARARLDGIRAFAGTIGAAIGQALALAPAGAASAPSPAGDARTVLIAIAAEQGFAGTFSERILDAVLAERDGTPGSILFLVGDRGLMVAGERGVTPDWTAAMIAHVDEAAALANRIAEALFDRIATGAVHQVRVIHATPATAAGLEVVTRALIPFDFARFPVSPGATRPLITLPPAELLAGLAEEYVFAELCEAIVLSFSAENEARMRAMIAARTNVAKSLDALVARSRQLRQEEITNEIVELASGAAAGGE